MVAERRKGYLYCSGIYKNIDYGGIIMNYNAEEQRINDEIKENILKFYKDNSEVCDRKYFEVTDKDNFKIYEKIVEKDAINSLLLKSSIVILTANEFEKRVLHLNVYKKKKEKIKHVEIDCSSNVRRPFDVNMYFFEMGGYYVLHMHAKETGAYTLGGAADLIRYVMKNKYCFPTAIISFGICFGNDYKELKIGDTIIAKKLYPYFMSAKIKEKGYYVKDSNIFEIDSKLDARIQHLKGQGELDESKGIHYGNMITGEAVISNALLKKIFSEAATNQPVLGGEMEGYALFKECQGFECSIPCLLIKSICDWGACKNIEENCGVTNLKDRLQAYAAERAYQVLAVFMADESGFFERTIFEQIKEKVHYELSGEKVIIPALVDEILQDMLNSDFKENSVIVQKCAENKKLSLKILNELAKENIVIIEDEDRFIYRIK